MAAAQVPTRMVRELWSRRCPSSAPPDSSRYIFVGSAVLLLVGAEALAGKRLSPLLVGSLFLIVAVAVPRNIKLFENGRKVKLDETVVNRVEAGVEQLTGPGVKRDYAPAHDLLAASKGGAGPTSISAGQYLNAAPRVGPFGYSAAEILALVPLRGLADAVLADDGGLRVSPATAPADRSAATRFDLPAQASGRCLRSPGAVP